MKPLTNAVNIDSSSNVVYYSQILLNLDYCTVQKSIHMRRELIYSTNITKETDYFLAHFPTSKDLSSREMVVAAHWLESFSSCHLKYLLYVIICFRKYS